MPSDDAAANVRVLLIEDNEEHAYLISRYLNRIEDIRIAVSQAANLATGLRLLASQPFDVVLVDLRLPDSDFDETLSRTLPFDVPILVLSTLEDPKLAENALEQGAQAFLSKGNLSSELLCRAIGHALSGHGPTRTGEDASQR